MKPKIAPKPASRPRGFTIIELMIAISIIVVLVLMLFGAYGYVVRNAKVRDTRVALAMASTLLSNYEQATQFQRPPPPLYSAYWTGSAAGGGAQDFTMLAVPFWTGGFTGSGEPIPAPPNGNMSAAVINNVIQTDNAPGPKIALPQPVVDTLCVMVALEAIPDNQTILNNLPSNRKMQIDVSLTKGGATFQVPLLLDGWGNPILFVPGDGLYGVTTNLDPNYPPASGAPTYSIGNQIIFARNLLLSPPAPNPNTMTFYTYIAATPSNSPSSPPNPSGSPGFVVFGNAGPFNNTWGGLCAPNQRPFWVSGGPDGDVSKGDDNIYSFEGQ
jgi:prepilin-type N-terminal cleavage/methylation domain-containing protein